MVRKWRLVLGCLACFVVNACDDGAVVGGIGSTPGTPGSSGTSGTSNPGTSNVKVPEGVPDGAEIGEIGEWYGHTIATFATFDADAKTVKDFGTLISMASVNNIPPGAFMSYQWLRVPASVAEQTFIHSFQVDFMPMGHPPAKVYDVPHIETHAFWWSADEISRLSCQAANDNLVPSSEFIPAGTWNFDPMPGVPNCLPGMGVHGFDMNAPELNGVRFTQSLSVIVARGEFMSYEPKATVEELQKRKDFTIKLPAPQKLARATKIPTSYVATYLPAIDAYRMIYTDFVSVAGN
jgi:hypothetical protein